MKSPCGVAAILASLLTGGPAAARDTSLELCLAAAADRSPVYPTEILPAGSTREVTAVFRVPNGQFKKLDYAWVAVDVGDAAPPNYEIAKGSLAVGSEGDRGVLRLTGLEQPMPPGSYRLEVAADGRPWRSAEFRVAPMGAAPEVRRPADLLPLAEGSVWTYAFVQEAGRIGRISEPGVTPDPDGKVRATVTMTATGSDEAGTRIEMRRDGALVFQEWWRLDAQGLRATRRKTPQETIELKPPQLLLRFPLRSQTWGYRPEDGSYRQTYRMWGPLPVKGPQGEVPGFVVLTEQPMGRTPIGEVTLTAERHFLPGVGMVKEVIVQAVGEETLSRQEMVLTAPPPAR